MFSDVNIRNCVCGNVTKHRDIKGSDKYVTLDISLKFDSLEKMKITSTESKKNGKTRKGVDCLFGFQGQSRAKERPQKYKKSRYAIRNCSKKDLSKIIREFEIFEKLPYEKKRPKHEPTDSYFYPAI